MNNRIRIARGDEIDRQQSIIVPENGTPIYSIDTDGRQRLFIGTGNTPLKDLTPIGQLYEHTYSIAYEYPSGVNREMAFDVNLTFISDKSTVFQSFAEIMNYLLNERSTGGRFSVCGGLGASLKTTPEYGIVNTLVLTPSSNHINYYNISIFYSASDTYHSNVSLGVCIKPDENLWILNSDGSSISDPTSIIYSYARAI